MAGGNPRPNALGIDMIHNENDPDLGVQEKKAPFKRAATHVAIAYFIYLKSFDYGNISKIDRSKMDPTYNARLLKEKKKYEYPSAVDPSLLAKLLPSALSEYIHDGTLGSLYS